MAALVQTYPSQTIMSSQPPAAGGYNPSGLQQQSMRSSQMSRYNNATGTGYRGTPSSGLVAPYAFTSTPQLSSPLAQRPVQPMHGVRSASSSKVVQYSSTSPTYTPPLSPALSSHPSSPSSQKANAGNWPQLTLNLPPSESLMPLTSSTTAKPSPDRYRKPVQRTSTGETVSPSITPPGTSAGQLYAHPTQSNSSPSLASYQSYRGNTYGPLPQPVKTLDDAMIGRSQNPDLASRYRRRSLGAIETAGLVHGEVKDVAPSYSNTLTHSNGSQTNLDRAHQPTHQHTGSAESNTSSRSTQSARPTSARNDAPAVKPVSSAPMLSQPSNKHEPRLLAPPNRAPEPVRRTPSPLSRPVPQHPERVESLPSTPPRPQNPAPPSTAAQHLTALNLKDPKKSKSKIRRAFSFGSAAELRKATAQNNMEKTFAANSNAQKRTSKHEEELDPEQARIAARQEAAGLGESIYSGQGNFFTGSTDNLSVSSTASSASIMLRKMGKGMKKGTRSLVGLFRPKSVIGVPAADGPINAVSEAQVSMVTVEAERDRVNVNVNPHDQAGGGTGFPRLERNSIDAKGAPFDAGKVSTDSRSRRSIVGGEKERSEVLSAVKKGILKRNDLLLPSPRLDAHDQRSAELSMPHIPHINDTPRSSAPSTPVDEPPRSGHRRADSVAIEGNDHDDYFASVSRYGSSDSKNGPMTPRGLVRNISFSPRIQFHDTWPSGEYDRRGDIATCNRLTPMLAQQIKEELNSFKMEMEVHESSKVYTHFF